MTEASSSSETDSAISPSNPIPIDKPYIPFVVVVDDNLDDLDMFRIRMKQSSFEADIISLTSGEEAMDFLTCTGIHVTRQSIQPEMVFIDIKMPGMTGLDLIKSIRKDERTYDIPIVVLTGVDDQELVISCIRAGADIFLVKPIGVADVMLAIKKLDLIWIPMRPKTARRIFTVRGEVP